MDERRDEVSVADAYLDLLHARGFRYLFGNGGTDFGPVIDAYARRTADGLPVPEPVTVPHEIVAVAMAHGYTMVTGEPQAVMVHTVAGTANSIGGLINANRSQIPMLFSAGRTPLTEGDMVGARDLHIHWAQESFDQGSMAREWVKWDYELRAGSDLVGVVDRALAISRTEPQAPVYLTLPREVLAAEESVAVADSRPRMNPGETMAGPEEIERVAQVLAAADNPVLITRAAGRDPGAVAPLTALAERLGMGVIDPYPTHLNMAQDHRLYLATDPGRFLEHADVVVVVENDVPWTPKRAEPNAEAIVVGIAADPLHSHYPVRGFRVDLNLGGSVRHNLEALNAALVERNIDPAVAVARAERWSDEHTKLRDAADAKGEAGRRAEPLDKAWMSACVEALRGPETIIVNELGFDTTQLRLTEPGTFFGVSGAGVLGWGLGAALGAKLAAPDKTVVACIGDGSYVFGAPTAAHWVSRRMDLPVLFLVWNNETWGAVKRATQMVYPEGWAVKTGEFPFSDLGPSIDYEMICQAAGGHAERVEDPEELPAALDRARKAVEDDGRQALLNLIGPKP